MEWLLMLLPVGIGIVVAERIYTLKVLKRSVQNWVYGRVLPTEGHQLNAQNVTQFLNKLWQFKRPDVVSLRDGQSLFRSIYRRTRKGDIEWYLAVPQDRQKGFMAAFRSAFPMLEWLDVDSKDVAFLQTVYSGTYLKFGQKGDRSGLPVASLKDHDPLPSIFYSMGAGADDDHDEAVVDVIISPISDGALSRIVRKAENAIHPKQKPGELNLDPDALLANAARFGSDVAAEFGIGARGRTRTAQNKHQPLKYTELDPEEQNRVQAARRRYTGQEHGFKTWIRIGACGSPEDIIDKHRQATAAERLQAVIGGFVEWDYQNRVVENRNLRGQRAAKDIQSGIPPRMHEMVLSSPELGAMWHLPDVRHPVSKYIASIRKHSASISEDELTSGVNIGTLKHPYLENRQVAIPFIEFTNGFFLSGMTGSGKSSEAVQICDSIILDWLKSKKSPGFSYFDPAQETVIILLNRLMHYGVNDEQLKKVHFVSLRDTEYPIGLNLLHRTNHNQSTDALAQNAMELLKYAYGGDTPQMDRLLRNGLRTLLEDTSQVHSMVGLIPLFTDVRFRERVLAHVRDPILKMFWNKEFKAIEARLEQAIGPLLNRLDPFLSDKQMRRMFGQRTFSLELRKYMDEGHIFFWDLLGVNKEMMKLACGQILTQYHNVLQTRQSGSMNHFTIVDEGHEVQIPVMATIMSKDRKYGSAFGLITQFADQLDDWLVKNVRDNVQNIFSLSQGSDSAPKVSRMTNGDFDTSYLQALPRRTVAVYTRIDDVRRSFEVEAPPPYMYLPDGRRVDKGNEQEVHEATQWTLKKARELERRDGRSIKDIEEELNNYLLTDTALKTGELPSF
jgi:hypothetical protein